ncbi:MAG: hypothetical protein KatS3mg032_0425 [Cyclobacteriaceae bacterium]|nr:MAG: hypothetical protein KatS3mg032_0425 [Cyclobacteriaceae bacterium]
MAETPNFEWHSLRWFYPEVIDSFQFLHPAWLYGIAALPLLFVLRTLLVKRFGKHFTLALTAKEWGGIENPFMGKAGASAAAYAGTGFTVFFHGPATAHQRKS